MTRLERLRNRSYTAAIGSDINRLPIMNGILFNNDILYFNPHFTSEDVMNIYAGVDKCNVDNIIFIFTDNELQYSADEINRLNKLVSMFHLSKRKEAFVPMFVKSEGDVSWIKSPMKCVAEENIGYLGKSDNTTSIYTMLSFVAEYTFVISVVGKGFINHDLTNPVRNIFESELNSYLCKQHKGYSFDNVNIVDKLRGKYYLDFNSCMKSSDFVERLKNDELFSSGMNNLDSKNVIVNISITDRRFIK